ncbi:hypothetical protein D3C72_2482550 [compost metagenome]
MVVYRCDVRHVSAAQRDFFFHCLCGGIACHGHFALVAVIADFEVADPEFLHIDISFNGCCSFAVEVIL